MNPKYRTLEWWAIAIWFLLNGFVSLLIIVSRPIPPINYTVLFAGVCMMIYCASMEEEWFPPEPKGEAEQDLEGEEET